MKGLLLLSICTYNLSNAQWTNGQSAFRVLGPPNFTSTIDDDGNESATTLDRCSGIAIDVANSKMYIVDEDNNRVLRYAYPITSDQQAADLVFGQASFTSATTGTTQNTFNGPSGVAVDNTGRLWVSETLNNRVVWFNSAHTISSNQPPADGVLGQALFNTNTSALSQSGMSGVKGISISAAGTLFAVDRVNHRVLRFDNAAVKVNGANADGVLGQTNFSTGTSGLSASKMNFPHGVFIDANGVLWVVDRNNHRVLRFDAAAGKADGADADGVLGQMDFISGSFALTQSRMQFPMEVTGDNSGRLYMAGNHRVLIFNNAAGKANGANADNVLGQTDFTTGTVGTTAAKVRFTFTSSVAVDNTINILWVTDTQNSRAIAFQASSALPVAFSWFKGQSTSAGNLLSWQTATELINEGFEVQRAVGNAALEAGRWQVLAFVAGNGSTNEIQNYSYTDERPQAGLNYYRLKQIDFDGKSEYSDIVSVQFAAGSPQLEVFPNPVRADELTLYLPESNEDKVTIRLFDQMGRLALQQTTSSQKETLNVSPLAAGIYFVEVTVSGKVFREKVVVE